MAGARTTRGLWQSVLDKTRYDTENSARRWPCRTPRSSPTGRFGAANGGLVDQDGRRGRGHADGAPREVHCALPPRLGDPTALAHESYSRLIQQMVSYDQLDVTNIAAAELAIRQLQLLEERQMHAAVGNDSAAAEEKSLFPRSASGHGAIVISPDLKSRLSTEMAREASVLKERHKAREERNLARRPVAKGGKKGGAGHAGGDE